MAKQSGNERNAGFEAVRISLDLEALEQRILLSNPGIGYLSDSPDPVNQGSTLTLVAHNVLDPDGDPIANVKFYRSVDNIANPLNDTLLGSGVASGSNNWTFTDNASWASGNWYYFAIAQDPSGHASTAALTAGKVNALPTVTSLTGGPQPTGPGSVITLTANGVADSDGTVAWVDFYHDANNNGVWDNGDTFLGRDSDGQNGWTQQVTVQWTTGDYFARARDNNGAFGAFVTGHVDQRPVVGALQNNPNPAVAGQFVTFVASGVTDSDGTVQSVSFYRDADGNGSWDPSKDQLLGTGGNLGGGNWQLIVLDDWQPGVTPLYFAVATDNEGFQSRAAATLNQNPTIDSIQSDQTAITLGSNLNLQAVGVQDTDGSVNNVVFSVASPSTWWPFFNSPTAQHQDGTLGDGWTWPNINVDWSVTSVVKADFNNDGFDDLAVSVDVTSGGGTDFIAVLTNNGNAVFTTTSLISLYDPNGGANYNPTALAVGDFNEDGSLDIAAADSGAGRMSVLVNDGSGTFGGYTDFSANFTGDRPPGIINPDNIAVGDYTGDGHLDVVAYSSTAGEMPVWLGDGTGAFTLNRIYSYGSSRWADFNTNFPAGSVAPPSTVGVQDMISTDLDQHEDGGADLAMVGQGGLLTLFDYIRGLDTTAPLPDNFDIFGPGNVIGRAFETGLTGGVAQTVGFHYEYRTGNTWDFANGDASMTDSWWLSTMTDSNVDMYHVALNSGQTLTAAVNLIQGADTGYDVGSSTIPGVFGYLYDSTGAVVGTFDNGTPATATMAITYTATADGDYYLAVASMKLVTTTDSVDPFTGYFVNDDVLPAGGSVVQYTMTIGTDAVGAIHTPVGAGTSIAAADFMEDNFNNNGGFGPTNTLKDTDLGIANSLTDSVTTLFGSRTTGTKGRLAYDSFYLTPHVYGLGGHSPTSIAAYNIDSDTTRSTNAQPDGDWAQGSTGRKGDGSEQYNDLVTTNADGSMSVLINTGEYSNNFGIHEYAYTGTFNVATLNYNVENSAFGGPLQDPVGIVVGDFNGDGLADFAVAEKYDVAALGQAFPFHSSDPLDLSQYADENSQLNLAFGFSGRYSVVSMDVNQLPVTYYATAFDNDYGWPNNQQYQGYSVPTSLTLVLNQRPVIWSLTANNTPLAPTDPVTLTANGVQDLDGYVAEVDFYLWRGVGQPDPTQDTLLSTDRNAADGWTYTGVLGATNAVYYAVAVDNDGASGAPVATDVNVDPTIAALYADGRYDFNGVNDHLILGPAPAAGTIGIRPTPGVNALMFNDANNNGRWDAGEELWLDQNGDGKYNEESLIYKGVNGVWDTIVGTVGASGTALFQDSNHDGHFEWNEAVWLDANHNGKYDLGETLRNTGTGVLQDGDSGIAGNVYLSPTDGEIWADAINDPADTAGRYDGIQETHVYDGGDGIWQTRDATVGTIGNLIFRDANANGVWNAGERIWADEIQQGQTFVLTAVDVAAGANATTNNIEKVEFYLDSNYDGVFEPGTDTFLGRGVDMGNTRGGGADEWQLELWQADPVTGVSSNQLPIVTWDPGTRTYFAVVQDASDNWSAPASATDNVINLPPLIASVADTPDPVTQGQNITLNAIGVEDHFGQVNSVAFYLDTISPTTLLGIDESSVGGWTFTGPVTWGGGVHTYWAQVTDNSQDPASNTASASTTGTVNLPPIIGNLTGNPEPVTQDQTLTLQALNVHDQDGDNIVQVQFYRDSNANGTLDVGVDQLLSTGNVTYLSGFGDKHGTWQWQGAASFPVGQQLYFARALDSRGGYSATIGLSGRVQNAPPTIGSLAVAPDPVTQGYNLTLTAQNVTDSNGTVAQVEFYRDTNGNGSLDVGIDDLLGTVTFSNTKNFVLVQPVTWGQGLQLYFARAQDNEGAWSTTAFAQGTVNARPAVGQLTADPSPLVPGDTLTLTASGVSDADGNVVSVTFYRDTNGDGIFEANQDGKLGTDTNGADGWTWADVAETTAVRRFFAVATDNVGGDSLPASVDVQRRPTLGSMTAFPNPVIPSQQLVLTANNVNDVDGTVDSVDFFRDQDGDGVFDPALDQFLGTDTTPGDGWSVTVSPNWGGGTARFFARANDNEGNTSLDAYAPTTTTYVDFAPQIAALNALPNPVNRGDNLTLTAQGVTDADGTIAEVDFYRDTDGNGLLDTAVDEFLGRDAVGSGSTYSLVASTNGWPLGSTTFFAQAFDDLGAASDPASTPGRVNGVPLIAGLQASPDPVVRGNFLNLTGQGVTDLDGVVTEVRFYRDTNGNGTWDSSDALVGTDTIGSDGWQVQEATAPLVPGLYTFFARPVDNDGAIGLPATTTATVTTAPALVIALQPGSDTGVSQTDGITSDTTPTFDFVVNDVGTIQIDWNNDGIFDQSVVSGGAGTYSVTSPAFAAGSHTIAGRFTDYAAHVTNATDDILIDTSAPAKPDAPDLQAASDNGLSNTDNITSILTPTFDVASTDTYFRFFRGGVELSGDYQTGTTFAPGLQVIGTFNFTVEAVDAAGNVSAMSDPLSVQFTARPATPPPPDLQASSDSGFSNTDNLTNVLTPVFDVTAGIPPNYLIRLWRGTTLVNTLSNATVISDPTAGSVADGTYDYTTTVLNAANEESLNSAPLAVTFDRTAPTVTAPNISLVLVVDNGVKGVAEAGDVVQIAWNNSAGGDNNPDVFSAAVDLSQFGLTTGPAAMYDDGTHGDATAGDRIWTLNYTITGTGIISRSANVTVLATDNAGNVGSGTSTTGIRVQPRVITEIAHGGFDLAIYDVNGGSSFKPQDIVVKMGTGNAISSITIVGTDSAEGLGIAIHGATSIGSIIDKRTGPLGNIAFIAADAPITSIQLKSNLEGYNLNDQVLGGLRFATDIDGDGSISDLTGLYSTRTIGTVKIAGSVTSDVWFGGAGTNFSTFQMTGAFHGDLISLGSAGAFIVGGSFGSDVSINGSLKSMTVTGDMLAGAHVFVKNTLSTLAVGGSLRGNATEAQYVQVLAGTITKATIAGSVNYSRILAGANLGADWAVGGTDANADTFNVGQIGTIAINGNVFDSLIGAGLVSHNGGFDLQWLKTNNAFLNGSVIGNLTIKGTLTSDASVGVPFGVGAYHVNKFSIHGSNTNPLVFSEV